MDKRTWFLRVSVLFVLGLLFVSGDRAAANATPDVSQLIVSDLLDVGANVECEVVADFYRWRYRSSAADPWTTTTSTSMATETLTGLNPDTRYELQCEVVCKGVKQRWSNSVLFSTLPICERPSSDSITVEAVTSGGFSFRCSVAADRYRWRYKEEFGVAWRETVSLQGPSATVVYMPFVPANSNFIVQVQVGCGPLTSEWSRSKSFTTPCLRPHAFELSVSSISETGATLRCDTNADSYDWRYRELGETEWTDVVSIGVFSFVGIGQLAKNTEYQWACRVTCDGETSEWSDTQRFQTECAAATRSEVDVVSVGRTMVSLTCTAPGDRYKWRIREDGELTWSETFGNSNPAQTFFFLSQDTRYEFSCGISCGGSTFYWSDVESFRTLPPCPAPTAENLEVLDLTHASVQLSCTAAATEFRWRYREQGSVDWIETEWSTRTSLKLVGLPEDTLYEFACQLDCNGDISDWSPTQTFRSLPTPTLKVETVRFDPETKDFTLSWNSAPGETFRVEYSLGRGSWNPVASGLPANNNQTRTEYTYQVLPVMDQLMVRVARE